MRRPRFARSAAAAAVAISSAPPSRRSASSTPPRRRPPQPASPACPLKALAKAKGVVDITFWESATRPTAQTLQGSPVASTRRKPRST